MKYLLILFMIISSIAFANRKGIEESLEISRQGVMVQQAKMQVIAENIANVHTTKTETGDPYKRKDIIIRETEKGVEVKKVVEDNNPPIKVYEPGHPDADINGFVYYPNISVSKELTDMAFSSKVYEANVLVFNTAKNMAQSIINLGK
jgi:flagellar basal-body rod protein FlgC